MIKFYPLCTENLTKNAGFSSLARNKWTLVSRTIALVLLLMAGVTTSQAQAFYNFLRQVNPSVSVYQGNSPDYCQQGQLLRTNDWFSGAGPYYLPIGSNSSNYIVKLYNVTESSFSWESKLPISTLVVKAGDFARMYSYPASTFSASDVLTVQKSDPPAQYVPGPKNGYFRISHIELCYTSCELSASASVIDSSCDSAGSVTISPSGQQYSLDGENWQSNNVFNNLLPGKYWVYVSSQIVDSKPVCAEPLSVIIGGIPPGPARPSAIVVEPTCESNTSSITVSDPTPGLVYSIDGLNYQSEPIFSNLTANTAYRLTSKDSNGCVSPSLDIAIGPLIKVELTTSSKNVSCNGAADGLISAIASQNALITVNGEPYVEGHLFGPGTYLVVASTGLEDVGCTVTREIIITEPSALTASSEATVIAC
ncbi:MAG: hypothetical protein ACO3FI_12460, partial [Cyclobacteriaceae bacterium]